MDFPFLHYRSTQMALFGFNYPLQDEVTREEWTAACELNDEASPSHHRNTLTPAQFVESLRPSVDNPEAPIVNDMSVENVAEFLLTKL